MATTGSSLSILSSSPDVCHSCCQLQYAAGSCHEPVPDTTQAREGIGALRELLGEEGGPAAAVGEEPRFSKRKRALEPEQQMQANQYHNLLQEHAAKERWATK